MKWLLPLTLIENNFIVINENIIMTWANIRSLRMWKATSLNIKSILNSTNFAKSESIRRYCDMNVRVLDSEYNSHCMVRFWRSSTCDAARRLGQCGRGAGRGVCCRVQWTTRRRTRSRRMINNENTAKQTVAARGMSGTRCGSQNTDAARTGRESASTRDALKIDARSATGIQRSYVISTATLDEWRHGGPMRPPLVIVLICALPFGVGLFCGLTLHNKSEHS